MIEIILQEIFLLVFYKYQNYFLMHSNNNFQLNQHAYVEQNPILYENKNISRMTLVILSLDLTTFVHNTHNKCEQEYLKHVGIIKSNCYITGFNFYFVCVIFLHV